MDAEEHLESFSCDDIECLFEGPAECAVGRTLGKELIYDSNADVVAHLLELRVYLLNRLVLILSENLSDKCTISHGNQFGGDLRRLGKDVLTMLVVLRLISRRGALPLLHF